MFPMQPEWKRSIRQTILHVAGLCLVFTLIPISTEHWWLGLVIGLLVVVGSVPLTVKRIKGVSTTHAPYLEAGLAILMMVAMVVIGFASMYMAMSKHNQQFPDIHTKLDAVYFTVTTLATVGYGDLVPGGQLARAIAMTQMIVDILVIGVAARLAMRVAGREADARKS
jgi:voltage-gated potassium channel